MKRRLILFILLLSFLPNLKAVGQKEKDRELIDKVAIWQIEHQSQVKHHDLAWTNGVLFRGMIEWADYTQDDRYYDFLMQIGKRHNWKFLARLYHADDIVVAQMYIRMFEKYNNPAMIQPTIARVDSVVANPSKARLWLGAPKWSERWSWCDALFMAPPVYGLLNKLYPEKNYLDFMDKEFKEATDSLYDTDSKLYYRDRRYITKREKNGEKVFWGRGNGWVFAGLPLLLQNLPKEHTTYNYYLKIYKEMASAVLDCQDEKGSWHASMLDPKSYPSPENSASGFFVYGLTWGINQGILKGKRYKKAALKGWNALKSYVHEDGMLGYVQPVSAAPEKVTKDMTEVYGVGAFLLAGIEILKMK
nr:glycoside hydrolase family 88 protein [uncultured Bacteroides sp.]